MMKSSPNKSKDLGTHHQCDEEYNKKMKQLLKNDEKVAISKKPKRQQLYKLFKLIINRENLEYNYFHTLEDCFRCICCRSRQSLKD